MNLQNKLHCSFSSNAQFWGYYQIYNSDVCLSVCLNIAFHITVFYQNFKCFLIPACSQHVDIIEDVYVMLLEFCLVKELCVSNT